MVFMYNLEIEGRTKRSKVESNPLKNTLSKLIQNIDILEKFYSDKEYRDRLDKHAHIWLALDNAVENVLILSKDLVSCCCLFVI